MVGNDSVALTDLASPHTAILVFGTLTVPINVSPPFIVGIGQVGQSLVAMPGAWTGYPTGYLYQWNRNGVPIQGAVWRSYTVTSVDFQKTLSVTVVAVNQSGASAPVINLNPQFAVYKSIIGGGAASLFASDPIREINHFRTDPTGRLGVATQYNTLGSDGFARETGDYTNTQINLYNLSDGSFDIIAPAAPTQVAAGPSWSPDGKFIFWTTSKTRSGKYGLARYELATHVTTTIFDPGDVDMGDWELSRDGFTFAMAVGGGSIFVLNKGIRTRLTTPPDGWVDTDPHWSPDGTKLALIRKSTNGVVSQIVVVSIGWSHTNLGEITFPVPGSARAFDGPATWSSDGKLLISWHIDLDDFASNTIFTIAPDGSNRTSIALVPQAVLVEPYFSTNGSAPSTEFYFSAFRMPIFAAPK